MNIVYNLMLYAVWFLATYYVVLITLIMITGKDKLFECKKSDASKNARVSVIVPAYNEEGKIRLTIRSLKRIIHPNIEFIIINDGSKDGTSREVRESIDGDSRFVFINRKENKGKAASMNEGIKRATGEFIATMDADSMVESGVFTKALPYFAEKDVGAVTISVRVKSPKRFLHKIIDLEYIIGLSLLLKVFSMFDSIFVTPGPFSVYRRNVLMELNGFDEKSLTEDMEIAYRIQKHHYKILNCLEAKVYTIIPPTFKKIAVQRKRWYTGAIYTLLKHKDMMLTSRYGAFGFVTVFNYSLILLGLILFISSIYLGVSNSIDSLLYLKYTNLNLLERLKDFHVDLLALSRATILGLMSLMFTITTLVLGLFFSRTSMRSKRLGMLGYPLLFFMYQYFWVISIISVIRGKKVSWR